jgi:hypothetical protein
MNSLNEMTPRSAEELIDRPSRGSYQIITSIKSANMTNSDVLFNSRYLMPCPVIDMRNGFRHKPDDGQDWKFSIAVERNDENTHLSGLEDALFVVRDDDGDLDVPEGYEVDSANILEDYSRVSDEPYLSLSLSLSLSVSASLTLLASLVLIFFNRTR